MATETRITSEQGKEAVYQAHLSKDAIEKINGLEANSLQINYIADEERKVPSDFDISLLPYFRVWKKRGTRLFETNIKVKKLFEDIFADKIVYVDIATGNDTTGDGTILNPYKTIYKGIRIKPLDQSNGGKLTVYVKAGIYADANGWNGATPYADEINVIGYNGLVYSTQSVAATYGARTVGGTKSYVENIVFDGGRAPFSVTSIASVYTTGIFKNCAFKNSVSENCFQTYRNGLYILENCITKGSVLDGFCYHNYETENRNVLVIEINCEGSYNGVTGVANNGSTVHDGINIIRINCKYNYNANRNVHDIGGCRSWNLGCDSSYGVDITQPNFVIGSGDTDSSIMWLDSCTSNGDNLAVGTYNSISSVIYVYDFEDNCTTASTYTPIAYDYKA